MIGSISLASILIFINSILSIGIAVTAFSLLLYIVRYNWHSPIARAFSVLLTCVILVSAGDAVLYSVTQPIWIARWLRLQWLGIALAPAAYLHFSDEVLRTTNSFSRVRQSVVVLAYALSALFMGLALFSDGRIQDLDALVVGPDELAFHRFGQSPDNVGVTAMNARRSYEQPEQVEVFASLANYGAEPVTRNVQLAIDGNVQTIRSVTISAAQTGSGEIPFKPGQTAVNFSLSYSEAGVLEVRQLGADALAGDDAAWSILEPPKRLSVLLVTNGNPVLESALQACPLARLDPCTPAGFDALDPAVFTLQQRYDVIVLDNHVPARTPQCRYLVFGPPPRGIDVNCPQELDNQVIVDWRSQHPVLQYVNLTNFFALKGRKLELPRDAEVLAEFNESPALALVRRQGSTYLLAGFDILQSNWPFEPSFILFCYNAVSFLGAQVGSGGRHELAVGEPIAIESVPGETVLTLIRPDATKMDLQPDPGGTVRFPGTQRVGVYAVHAPGQPSRCYAVNLLDAEESRIEPQDKIKFSSVAVAAQEQMIQRANVPLWPPLVLAALVLVCLEWLAYNLKVRI